MKVLVLCSNRSVPVQRFIGSMTPRHLSLCASLQEKKSRADDSFSAVYGLVLSLALPPTTGRGFSFRVSSTLDLTKCARGDSLVRVDTPVAN